MFRRREKRRRFFLIGGIQMSPSPCVLERGRGDPASRVKRACSWSVVGFVAASSMVSTTFVTMLSFTSNEVASRPRQACNVTSDGDPADGTQDVSTIGGILLAICGNVVNGFGISAQKHTHIRSLRFSGTLLRFYYFYDVWWWVGVLGVVVGETANAVSYSLAPISVVSPMGGFSLLVTSTVAYVRFRERPAWRVWAGSLLILVGISLISTSTSDTTELYTAPSLITLFERPGTQVYMLFLLAIFVLMCVFIEPVYAKRSVLVWSFMAALCSAFTVIASRGFFSMVLVTAQDCRGELCHEGSTQGPCMSTVLHPLFWALLLIILLTAPYANFVIEQRGLSAYDQIVWVPVHFATCVLVFTASGAVVYGDLQSLSVASAAMFSVGLCATIGGVIMCMRPRPSE